MSSEQLIKISAKLYQCRDTARRFFREEYKEKIEPYIGLIKTVSRENNIDTLNAVIKIALLDSMQDNGMAQMLLFAAAVEIIEPSK